jgi:hypothetical protein
MPKTGTGSFRQLKKKKGRCAKAAEASKVALGLEIDFNAYRYFASAVSKGRMVPVKRPLSNNKLSTSRPNGQSLNAIPSERSHSNYLALVKTLIINEI